MFVWFFIIYTERETPESEQTLDATVTLLYLQINFVIFILVVRVVGSKLKVNQRHQTDMSSDYRWRYFHIISL